jgi:hypothetical protein
MKAVYARMILDHNRRMPLCNPGAIVSVVKRSFAQYRAGYDFALPDDYIAFPAIRINQEVVQELLVEKIYLTCLQLLNNY